MSRPRVFFHVQHLLGTGHLSRAATIASALAAAGMEVDLVSGGMPVPGIDAGAARLVQLPPARVPDARFIPLLDAAGNPADQAWRDARRAALLGHFDAARPDVLVTELFPFGRRILEFELLPLLEQARARRPRPLVLSSVRDVLTRKPDPKRREAQVERAVALYDRVLVHGDPALIAFSASLPEAERLGAMAVHTGYVRDDRAAVADAGQDGAGEVVVSAGGGVVGERLLRTAIAARALSAAQDRTWRLLVGANLPAERLEAVRAAASSAAPGIIVEPARRDFPALLRRCHVSVSQAGYNTAMDILSAGARAVLVPFAAEAETEQADRAAALARRGWAQVVAERDLDPRHLAAAVDAAGRAPRPDPSGLRLDGAAVTARLIREWVAA